MTLNDFAKEVSDYMYKKLPDVNAATILEIAEFTTMKAHNYTIDELEIANEKWCKYQDQANKLYLKYIEKRI